MTLNELIDDILNIARNNNLAESEHLSRTQIEYWIKQYRILLMKREIDRGYDLNYDWVTTIPNIHISKVEDIPGIEQFRADYELPKLIDTHRGTGLLSVKDGFGNLIQLGDETKMKYQKYRRNTCKDYIAYVDNNYLYIQGGNNTLEYITIECILEDPTDIPCYDPDTEFPVPMHLIPEIRQMICTRELGLMVSNHSDETNDSRDDNVNLYSAADAAKIRRNLS